jgi:Fur family transcriptional regulator, ferric uptake regulator
MRRESFATAAEPVRTAPQVMMKVVPAPRRPVRHVHETGAGPGELRARGRRLTRQRQLIWDAFAAEPDEHLSAEDVAERVRAQLPQVNPSTVYRTLDLLVAEGLLLRTDLGGDRAYFEPAREHAHHHLVCRRCGTVQHLHDEELGDVRERVDKSTGFSIGPDEITFTGLCRSCKSRSAATRGR